MGTGSYVIRGGLEGRERLRVLARVMAPTTHALLDRIGVPEDARCLDVGCGGGDVSLDLARRCPRGTVVGIDLDATKLDLARADAVGVANVAFRQGDVTAPPAHDERFDLVYVRFVLTHLTEPARVVSGLVGQLAPGGVLVVEDIDFTGHFCHPESPAFRRYVEWYTRAVQGRGADPDIGPRLPSLLRAAGLGGLGMNVVQPAGFEGEVTLIPALTLEAIADAVLTAGLATADQIGSTVDELQAFAATPGTVLSLPRIVQAWGRRST